MDNYVTGKMIKAIRENMNLTQLELANNIGVSEKTISKWETGRGYPDISLLEPLSKALKISIIELINGESINNNNKSANMLKSKFYVCPICGNIITSVGNAQISCCGVSLYDEEATNDETEINVLNVENEYFVSIEHEMTKSHYISFVAYVTSEQIQIKKTFPEMNAECRFIRSGHGNIYAYCNRHGLFCKKI